jgi:hypothetical protein
MSYLTPDKMPIGFSLDRPMAEHGYDKEQLTRFGHIPRFKFELLPLALKSPKRGPSRSLPKVWASAAFMATS